MILQSLCDYYQRKAVDPDPSRRLSPFGFEDKEIPFIIELKRDGEVLGVSDTRIMEGKKKRSRSYRVPKGVKKAFGVSANLLWDTAEYVLGVDTRGRAERVAQQHKAFLARIDSLSEATHLDEGIEAVAAFLRRNPERVLATNALWEEILETNPVLTFRLADESDLICQRPAVVRSVALENKKMAVGEDASLGICLITGEETVGERVHTAIKGVWGAQTSGANIVSFNKSAFDSFGKMQGANAPIGKPAAFAYTTALNCLLGKDSRQRMQVGDASTVFWAQVADEFEEGFASFFSDVDDPDARTEKIRALLLAVQSGKFDGARGTNRFYVLGLSPNAARIAIRFWHAAPLHEIAQHVRQWFRDIELVRGRNDPEHPSLFRLLTACAAQNKADNVPPKLGGDIMRAILTGGPLPESWLIAAVQRCRAEQSVNYLRAAAIKACLNRSLRRTNEKELLSMLDLENKSVAYRLGRLFSVLEKIQEEANPGLNATIRDRFFGAASSTPVAVFTTLLRLKNHHLAKLSNRGRAVNFEKLVGEIVSSITDFPSHLALPDQGRFALGYYHQRQAFFEKPDASEPNKGA